MAVIVVRYLLDYVSRRGFALFAWWRLIVGGLGLIALFVWWRIAVGTISLVALWMEVGGR